MAEGLGSFALSTKMRDTIVGFMKPYLDQNRPRVTYAVVVSVDTASATAVVQFNGPDAATAQLKITTHVPAVGDTVRIEGNAGDRFITEVTSPVSAVLPTLRQRFGSIAAQIIGVGTSGVSPLAAAADHVHALTAGTPTGLTVGGSNTTGSATSVAASNHVHAVPKGSPVALTVGNAAADGTSTNFADAGHVHGLTIPTQEATGSAGIGSSNSWVTAASLSLAPGSYVIVAKGQIEISVGAVNPTYQVRLRDTTNSVDLDTGDVVINQANNTYIPFALTDVLTVASTLTVAVQAQRTDTFNGSQTCNKVKISVFRYA